MLHAKTLKDCRSNYFTAVRKSEFEGANIDQVLVSRSIGGWRKCEWDPLDERGRHVTTGALQAPVKYTPV